MTSNKIKINKLGNELIIEYKWFKFIAFFLVFFCIIWDGFLVVWYTALGSGGGGADIIFMLFPLIHVAVGVGLSYYTLALFINKTIITVNRDSIDIKHTPLPWAGSKNILTQELEQLFVKQKASQGKNGTTYTYALLAMQKGVRKPITLVGSSVIGSADDAQLIEEEIEQFLGIKDYKVRGEFESEMKIVQEETPRQQEKNPNPTKIDIKDLKKGAFLTYKNQNWEVVFQTQYDWSRGDTDRLYQLVNDKSEAVLLFVQQDMGLLNTWIDEKISYDQIEVQKEIFKEQLSARQHIDSGNFFTSNDLNVSKIKQWRYISRDKKESLRVLQHDEQDWSAFLGKKVDNIEFTDILIP